MTINCLSKQKQKIIIKMKIVSSDKRLRTMHASANLDQIRMTNGTSFQLNSDHDNS